MNNKDKQEGNSKMSINCEEWANAKLPRKAEISIFVNYIIFRNLIKI